MTEQPDLNRRSFARTNAATVAQRAALLRDLLPGTKSIAEICCGDCSRQHHAYDVKTYRGLDLNPQIVAANRARGIDCVQGDALDERALRPFAGFDVVFFGPPLSRGCDGHSAVAFSEVVPSYAYFARLLLGELEYKGTLVCIGPNTTTMGDARKLHSDIRAIRPDFGLRLIHRSHSRFTGEDVETELRLKYVELWFSCFLTDEWEVRD